MAAVTLEQAKEMLASWLEAEKAVMSNQSYSIGSRSITRANLSEIRKSIQYWSKIIDLKERKKRGKGTARISSIIPMD